MTTNTLDPKWRGRLAEPIDPSTTRFKAAPAPVNGDCIGCIFMGQRTTVCFAASEIAVAAGQVDCDDPWPEGGSVIYVKDDTDPRQLALPISGAAPAATDAAPVIKTD
jgi:hypothetical protein